MSITNYHKAWHRLVKTAVLWDRVRHGLSYEILRVLASPSSFRPLFISRIGQSHKMACRENKGETWRYRVTLQTALSAAGVNKITEMSLAQRWWWWEEKCL